MGSEKKERLKKARAIVKQLHKLATSIAELDGSASGLLEDFENAEGVDAALAFSLLGSVCRKAAWDCEEFSAYFRER